MSTVHARHCEKKMEIKKTVTKEHAVSLKLCCSSTYSKSQHQYEWSYFPHLASQKFLLNERINHAFVTSGLLPSHYERFCNAAGIGIINTMKPTLQKLQITRISGI